MKTYEAIIDGDNLTWIGIRPDREGPFPVTVTMIAPAATDDGDELNRIVNKMIAAHGHIRSIDDPVEWQRDQRIDRPLPGREP